jgi:crotonobetainyl-CoA:carnitine CoA-transferase CaiB-like acyl-CoA transferase
VSERAALPLDGVTVVSVEHAIAAPLASRHLADLGARVIKVERPDGGDFARSYDTTVNGISSHFAWVNRTKESVVVDMRSDEGREMMERLLDRADVFLHNLAPGGIDRLGFGSEAVRSSRPRLITCAISGYGSDGPYRDRKAYDLLIQCETGVVSLTGSEDAPAKVGIPVADIAAGMYAYSGILAALLRRERNGEGATLEISMLEALGEWVGYPLLYARYGGTPPPRSGASHAAIAPYGPFPTADREEVFLSIQNGREWERFCATVLGDPAFATDPRFADGDARVANRAELDAAVAAVSSTLSAAELIERLEEAAIANARLRDMNQFAAHEQLAARDRWRTVDSPAGPVEVLLPPVGFGVEPQLGPIPALGADTDAVRAELGLGVASAPSSA